ncbi:MAG: YkgJ family cysteine cluster protein [Geobacteraceae bacterium]|nr:YkgJ family cysteine cluster protein [Geobacteraceae bacterium]
MRDLEKILRGYGLLLAEVDAWFARCLAAQPRAIACGAGCSECCRGLFDITLLDACYLKYGFDRLDARVQAAVRAKAVARLQGLQALWPDLREPYILNFRPEEEWEELMPEDDETPCPLVDNEGRCLLYNFRPMTCRLNGIPLVDRSGEVFYEEWCSLNFTGGDPLAMKELRGEFYRIFADELSQFQQFTAILCKQQLNELDTFIPTALLIDFAGFDWPTWLQGSRLVENPPC